MSGDLISIERELARLADALGLLSVEYEGLCRHAAEARTDYDVAWAQAMLDTNPSETVRMREAESTRVCAAQMREARIAEAIRDAAKERLRALESMLTVHQSRLRWLDEGKRFSGS